ncbi:hypothetical protein Y032_0095g2859 [Ancylostoma ceylanicum]|uniref:Uncharacterized protein n=1 Tax=Ancylostoma ceylanicum TaxID=53326 RepID=A0A016TJX9_9BILA|nr:hypothetical protein Y032_0095g2859 [Ancylostoma ceylanicum]
MHNQWKARCEITRCELCNYIKKRINTRQIYYKHENLVEKLTLKSALKLGLRDARLDTLSILLTGPSRVAIFHSCFDVIIMYCVIYYSVNSFSKPKRSNIPYEESNVHLFRFNSLTAGADKWSQL